MLKLFYWVLALVYILLIIYLGEKRRKEKKMFSRALDAIFFMNQIREVCEAYDVLVMSHELASKMNNPNWGQSETEEFVKHYTEEKSAMKWFFGKLPKIEDLIESKRPLTIEEFFSKEEIQKLTFKFE